MILLFWSVALFLLAFLLQILFWKIWFPHRQAKTLLVLFFTTFTFGFVWILTLSPALPNFGIYPPRHIEEYLHIGFFYWVFTMAYLITYSAVEVDSPSLIMTMAIHKTGKKGLPIDVFMNSMTDEILVIPRVNDLVQDKIAVLKKNIYKLSFKGMILAKIFNSYRSLLRLEDKGG